MPNPGIAIRLGVDGGADVKNTFQQIGDTGDATATRLARAFEQQSAAVEAAQAKLNATQAKMAAIQPQTAIQSQIASATGTGFGLPDKSAQTSAIAMRDLLAQEDALAARAETLKTSLDPLYAAQKKYDGEIANSAQLLAAGKISQELHTAQVAASTRALNDAKAALAGHSNALGLNRAQYITAQSAVLRFTDAIISGRSPVTAAALESHKLAEVMSQGEGGVAGGFATVTRFITPATVGITAFIAVLVGATYAGIKYAEQLDQLSRAADGYGRTSQLTGQQLLAAAQAGAGAAHVTVASAMTTEETILQSTRSSSAALTGAVAISQRLADALGTDLAGANKSLAAAMADPAKGADDLATKFGFLDQAQVQNIHELMEQNQLTQAQGALLAGLDVSLDKTGEHVNALSQDWRNLKSAVSGAVDSVGGYLSRMYDQITGQLNSAEKIAQLQGRIARDQINLQGFTFDRSGIERQIADYRQQIATLQAQDAASAQSAAGSARRNQLAQEVTAIERASGATNKYSQVLEQHRQVIAELQQAQRMGIAVDPQVLAGKEHQLRGEELIGGEGNREAAIQAARARMRNAAPHSKARQQAASDLEAINTAGRDMTDEQASAAARERGLAALGHMKDATDKHAESLAREAAAMVADTQETLKLADAYLQGGDAALIAEARRKATTDATKKGIDVEAQVRRQLDLEVAQGAATGAKAVAALTDETAARGDVNARVAAGTLAVSQMSTALSDEAALRPLLKLQTVAQGAALVEVTKIIAAYRTELAASHVEEQRGAALQAIDAATGNISALRDQMEFAGDRTGAGAIEIARRAAEREAQSKFGALDQDDPTRQRFIDSQVQQAQAKLDSDRVTYLAQQKNSLSDQLTLTQAQLDLVGKTGDDSDKILANLQARIDLQAHGIDLSSDEAKKILAMTDAQSDFNSKLRAANDNWNELKSAGDSFIDDVLNTDNWKTWGDFGRMVLNDLAKELEKLALINPLKNWLFGEQNPTGGGFLGALSKLFGGGGDGSTSSFIPEVISDAGNNASGTDYWGGGATWIAENGPELVNLPQGTKITPASQTRRLMAANDGGTTIHMPISIDASGADVAAVARLGASLAQLQRNLPTTIVTTMIDAKQRRWVS